MISKESTPNIPEPSGTSTSSSVVRRWSLLLRASGFTLSEITDMKAKDLWPTFGVYINTKQAGTFTETQLFLKTFAHLEWRQYSALSHGAYEAFIGTLGYIPVGAYYLNDFLEHEQRDKLD